MMWKRFQDKLRCVACGNRLELQALQQREASLTDVQLERGERLGLPPSELPVAVEQGLLICEQCCVWYPIYHGLPVMLAYWTNLHDSFLSENGAHVQALGTKYKTLHEKPAA